MSDYADEADPMQRRKGQIREMRNGRREACLKTMIDQDRLAALNDAIAAAERLLVMCDAIGEMIAGNHVSLGLEMLKERAAAMELTRLH